MPIFENPSVVNVPFVVVLTLMNDDERDAEVKKVVRRGKKLLTRR